MTISGRPAVASSAHVIAPERAVGSSRRSASAKFIVDSM
jgi:hypothetical protein